MYDDASLCTFQGACQPPAGEPPTGEEGERDDDARRRRASLDAGSKRPSMSSHTRVQTCHETMKKESVVRRRVGVY